MPTVLLLDVSLSMSRSVDPTDPGSYSLRALAVAGLTAFVETVSRNCKLEYTNLMVYSQLYERLTPFTRDYEQIKDRLQQIDTYYDKSHLLNALQGVQETVSEEWGPSTIINLFVVTGGYSGSMCWDAAIQPFLFPCRLHVVILGSRTDPTIELALPFYQRLVDTIRSDRGQPGELHFLDKDLSPKGARSLLMKIAEANYSYYKAELHCGSLSSPVSIFPSLDGIAYEDETGETKYTTPTSEIEIYGFMDIADIESPPIRSRHLIFAAPMTREQLQKQPSICTIEGIAGQNHNLITEMDEVLNAMANEDGRQPSLCVLLHGALKTQGTIALCRVGDPEWYGMLCSWPDSKKKFNLMLSTFACGPMAIKWLGDLRELGLSRPDANNKTPPSTPSTSSAVTERKDKSYQQTITVWIKQNALQSDIQKILRLAKRLPEKTPNFYKELTKFRKAAFALGFYGALDSLVTLLEREAVLLQNAPGPAAQEAHIQLTNAINSLRTRELTDRDLDSDITPIKLMRV